MKEKKLARLVIVVTSLAIIVAAAFYGFGGKYFQQRERYWWQEDAEIVGVSEKHKSALPRSDEKRKNALLLFPVIEPGASTRELEALFGKPSKHNISSWDKSLTYEGKTISGKWLYSEAEDGCIEIIFEIIAVRLTF